MKDIKQLYLTAKSSRSQRDISAYNEAVQEILESDPIGFISNLEYIIKSDANLPKLDEFVEKYGLCIPVWYSFIGYLNECVERCKVLNVDSSLYEEYLDAYQEYHDVYKKCFDMYEYYTDNVRLSDNYFEEKKTQIEYRVDAFKKKYNYNPTDKTITVNGKKYEIDMDYDNHLMYTGTNLLSPGAKDMRSTACVPGEDGKLSKIFLGPEFFRLNGVKDQDAILMHEIGHAEMMTKNPDSSRSKWRDSAKKYAKGSHLNVDEFEADRYAANRIPSGSKGISKQLQHVNKWQNKNTRKMVDNQIAEEIQGSGISSKQYKNMMGNDAYKDMVNWSKKANSEGRQEDRMGRLAALRDPKLKNDPAYKVESAYIKNYYSFNENGVQGRKLAAGMIQKFGAMAIPDMLLVAESIGESAVDTIYEYLATAYNDPIIFQWIIECTDYYEASTAPLKYDFRFGWDINTGHKVRVTYSLDNIEVTMGGHGYDIDGTHDNSEANIKHRKSKEVIDDIQKNIRKKGNTDHESKGQKILAIVDRSTGKSLSHCKLIGIGTKNPMFISTGANMNLELNPKYLKDIQRDYSHIPEIHVGDIETEASFKTTHAFKERDLVTHSKDWFGDDVVSDNLNYKVQAAEALKYGRGAKLNDLEPSYFGINAKFKHPSKKDKRRNPSMYESVYNNSLESIVGSIRSRNNQIIRESAIMGTDATMEYTDFDLEAIQNLISLKEYQLTCSESTDEAIELQQEIYSLYEEFDGLVNEDDSYVGDTNELDESLRHTNTTNKYNGNAPGYLSSNHDLRYGEDNGGSSVDDYRRPSAVGDDDEPKKVNDTISELEDPDETEDKKQQAEDQRVINNYYYNYVNSLNKNSNSFNKDSSSHDDHSDRSKHTDDHSTGKRINSNDYGVNHDESTKPWELNLSNKLINESSDYLAPEYAFMEQSDYYMDDESYDKHIKKMWFIKSDDNADNCCVTVEGYPKPMRGRSLMIVLKKEGDDWLALIKRKPNGQWEFPGGGWDKGEKPKDAAVRELHEEAQTKVKNAKRIGTQIQFNPKKSMVSQWVKNHVKNADDWWYGYYSAIFIGEEDGKFTGHINKEDYEDTFKWKPLSFIAKKFPHTLMDTIENYIQKEFHESVGDYISESVNVKNKKFDKAYKAAFNYDNGHMIKITYSLQGGEITNVGLSKAMRDHVASVAEETNKENHRGNKATKSIRAFMVILKGIASADKQVKDRKKMITSFLNDHIGEVGYLDFQAKNCKIIRIQDLYTGKDITEEIPIVGVYAARHMNTGKAKILSATDLEKVHKIVKSRNTKFHVSNHKVGDIEKWPTFMSTYWNDKEDHMITDLSSKVVDTDERDRSIDTGLDNIPDIIGDLELKGFHVSDEEIMTFIKSYRGTNKYIPDVISITSGKSNGNDSTKKESATSFSEAVGDSDDLKPESDHPIKDTLHDADRNLVKVQQAAKKKVQGVINTGKVFIKPAKRTYQWVTKLAAEWKDNDENKIKEKLADPHARKNLFSAISTAIKTGSLLKAGLLFNPIFLFLSVTRKTNTNRKTQRLRDEMIGELKTEMSIIDEKINDANRAGDNAAKYKLMRLKNELNKKLMRVGGAYTRSWRNML